MKQVNIFLPDALGDLFISLPIAGHYRDTGYQVNWAISKNHMSTMTQCAPWVNWIPLDKHPICPNAFQWDKFMDEHGAPGFLTDPEALIVNLYYPMPQLNETDMTLKFDQYRYAHVNLPFFKKWQLTKYFTRDRDAELKLFAALVKQPNYVVMHSTGSNVHVDLSREKQLLEEQGLQVIEIVPGLTDNAVNWLSIIEGASSLFMIDSCFANLVDQMQITIPKVFYRRSDWRYTPVLGMNWVYGSAPDNIFDQLRADYRAKGLPLDSFEDAIDQAEIMKRRRQRMMAADQAKLEKFPWLR